MPHPFFPCLTAKKSLKPSRNPNLRGYTLMRNWLFRVLRAAKLDRTLYQEAVADPKYWGHAIITVIAYSSFSGIGSFGLAGASGVNIGMVTTLVGWYIWAFTTYFVGARILPESKEPVERKAVFRAMGFATAPGLWRLLGLVPGMGIFILVLISLWMVVAAVIAVQTAFNYTSIWRALAVCLIGLVASIMVQILLLVTLFQAFGVSEHAL